MGGERKLRGETVFFVAGGCSPAYSLRGLLLSAGDVERNPGPSVGEGSCGVCGGVFRTSNRFLQCVGCETCSHMQKRCSGLTRAEQVRGRWWCRQCVRARPGGVAEASVSVGPSSGEAIVPEGSVAGEPLQEEQEPDTGEGIPNRLVCLTCTRVVPRSVRQLVCRVCVRPSHKKCLSGASRAEIDAYTEDRSWVCPDCTAASSGGTEAPMSTRASCRRIKCRREQLRILQWNCCGVRTKYLELENMLSSMNIDIALIQETHLRTGDLIHKFPGFTALSQVRKASDSRSTPSRGGVMILVKDDIPFSRMPNLPQSEEELDALEDLCISVDTGQAGGRLQFVNLYSPPIRAGPTERRSPGFNPNRLPRGRNVFIGGDVNAHSPLWDHSQLEDDMGRAMERWFAETGMLPLNDGTPTRVNLGTGGMSAPDLTVMDSSWAGRAEWRVIDDTGSDHSAIITVLDTRVSCLQGKARRMNWKWEAADWERFQTTTEERFQSIQWRDGAGIGNWNAQFCEVLLDVAKLCIPRVSMAKVRKPWMSREIREALARRNRLRHTVGENREEWLESCRVVRSLIEESRKRKWSEFVESLDSAADSRKVWKVVRGLSGSTSSCGRNEILNHRGKSILSDRGKAEAFMSDYARVSRLRIPKSGRCVASDVADRRKIPSPVSEEESPFSGTELTNALRSMKSKGAPGGDGICPSFLQNLGETGRALLLELLNHSWVEGELPQSWRDATIIPLLKSGKPADRTDSFRPVSLTSCIAKCLERMIASRLQWMAESRGWWCTEQAGFRKFRSCEDQVLRLTQSISDGFQQTKPLRTVLALLDFSKAYDTVWRDLLLQRLLDDGVPLRYVNWLSGFLRNRRARVRWESSVSGFKLMSQGLPQGSVLAPLLFLFYINPLVRELPSSVSASLYADDVAVWAQSRDKTEAARLVEVAVQKVSDWSEGVRLSLSVSKCEVAFFSSSTHEAKFVPQVALRGTPLRVTEAPVFLGVTLDRTLSMTRHASKVCGKITKRCRLIRALAAKDWGCGRRSLMGIYHALFRGVMDYCGPAWQPWLSTSAVAGLEVADHRALRAITGQLPTSPIDALHAETGTPRYGRVVEFLAGRAWEKARRLPVDHPRRVAAGGQVRHRGKLRDGWRELARRVSSECLLDGSGVESLVRFGPPPWEVQTGSQRWTVQAVLSGRSTKADELEVLRHDAVQTIVDGGFGTVAYTDGSAQSGFLNGGSASVVTTGSPLAPVVTEAGWSQVHLLFRDGGVGFPPCTGLVG
jgi:hypothetical protein